MKLNIIKDEKLINTFCNCEASFIGNLWAYANKSNTIKKASFSTYGDYSTARFYLYDSKGVILYEYKDIPTSWGLLNEYTFIKEFKEKINKGDE